MIFSVIEPNLPAMGLPVEKTYAIFLNALLERVSIKSENTAASLHRFLRILITNGLGNKIGNLWLFLDLKNYSAIEKELILYTPEQLSCFLSAAKNDTASHYLEFALALYCGLKAGEILNLKYDSFDLRAGTVTVTGMHIRNYSTNEHYESKAGQEKYSNRKLRGESNYRTLPVPDFLFDEIKCRKSQNERIHKKYPGLAEKDVLCLGPYGKTKTLSALNTRLKKITQAAGLPGITMGDLRYMYLASLIKEEKHIKRIMELFGYTNPSRMLTLCQQIAEPQGELSTMKFILPVMF